MIDYNKIREEFVKCLSDSSRIYMIEHYLKTYDMRERKEVPFLLFPRQKDFLLALKDYQNNVTTKPRQAGVTTTTAAFIACTLALASPESPETVLVIGNKIDLAQQMVTKIKEFLFQLPRWFFGFDYFSEDPKSEEMKKKIFKICNQSNLELCNGSKVVAKSSGENAARGVSSVSYLIFDEAAFIEKGDVVYAQAVATTSTGGHIVMISTPNGKDQLYYKTYNQAKMGQNNFHITELKWFQDPRYNCNLEWYKKDKETGEVEIIKEPTLNKKGEIEYREEHWDEMERNGYKPRSPWYLNMCGKFNNDEQKIAQELDVSFLGSASNVVNPEYIEMQEKLNVRDPLPNLKDPMSDDTWFWKPPIEGHRYLMSIDCLPENEIVMTDKGIKKIQDVIDGDKLVSKSGEYTNIVNFQRRDAVEEDVYEIGTYNILRKNRFTYKHPIWCSKNNVLKRNYKKNNELYRFNERYWEHCFDFVKAENVSVGDWIEIPNMYYDKPLSNDEILKHWNPNPVRCDFKIDNPLLDEDFWWFMGIWLAEGWMVNDTIQTVHHIKEKSYVERISSLVKNIFERNLHTTTDEQTNSIKTGFSSKELSEFILKEFGKGAQNKNIPEWMKFLPNKYKIKLLEGYFNGDGCITSYRKNVRIVSVSYKLLEDVQDIMFSLRLIPVIRETKTYVGNVIHGKTVKHVQRKYELQLGTSATNAFLKMIENGDNEGIYEKEYLQCSYFSKDYKYIYFKVKSVKKTTFTGYVYNFETEDHTFCCKGIATHNCSRGDSADRTAIEMIDIDGVDEDGMPIIEQVMEYHGKKLGDDVGEMAFHYGNMYGGAFAIVDCVGGYGDACVLTLQRLGYKNIYYDDPTLKTFTMERETSALPVNSEGRLPGFHSSSVRFQMLSNFANLVKTNAFKIRSKRVTTELETWIYKGDTGRMDHMDGCHDDTLTCIAMGLFVMQFSLNRLQEAKKKDAAILSAWSTGNSVNTNNNRYTSEISISPNQVMPFYTNKSFNNPNTGNCMWLFAGRK